MHSRRKKMVSAYYYVCFGLFFASNYSRLICAQLNFSIDGLSNPYNCNSTSGNLICLGEAHVCPGNSEGKFIGMLAFIPEQGDITGKAGLVYYNEPVKMWDSSTGKSASFNTSFSFAEVPLNWDRPPGSPGPRFQPGDGIAFLLTANNATPGDSGKMLGIFSGGNTSFKSIVVEFDNFDNPEQPVNDSGSNQVGFDFMNIHSVVARNASEVNVSFWNASDSMIYAWVEYSNETQQLEVRISNIDSRPFSPFLNYKVNLSDISDEYMWVGFSGSTGNAYSHYYVGDWTFESYGISPDPPMTDKSRSKVGLILGISLGAGVPILLAIAGVGLLLLYLWRKRQHSKNHSDIEDPMLAIPGMAEGYRFSYQQLSVATGGFSEENKLGQGGSGSVYRGVLPTSGTPVAVKKINGDSNQGEKQFRAEVLTISQLRHRNLIQLLGWCKDKDRYLIVYELMPNGSLDQVLFGLHEEHPALSWPQRLNIVRGTAAALDYLQQGWKQQVIHRDIKSSNIMLDDEWNAKLGDFGLARLVDHRRAAPTSQLFGTCGYMAPEVVATGKFTDKSDVFSFGALALEIACGRESLSESLEMPSDEVVLVDWVWQHLSEGALLSVVDRRLDNYDIHWMEVVLLMGLLCSHPNPDARPPMRHVVEVLAGDIPVPSVPMSKPAHMYTNTQSKSEEFLSLDS